jgi:hypothetical protein
MLLTDRNQNLDLWNKAENLKFQSSTLAWINEFQPGYFALFFGQRLLCVTDDWNEVLAQYRRRPPRPERVTLPRAQSTLLSSITINI